jgi:WD40 repeat protein
MTIIFGRQGKSVPVDSTDRLQSIWILFGPILLLILPTSSMGQVAERRTVLTEAVHATLAEEGPNTRLNNAVCSLCYAPDGSTLAVGLRDPNTILLLDSATLAVRDRLKGHVALISRLAFLPDGKTLVSSGHDGTIRIWDIATKRQRILLDQFQGKIRGLAISPDGKRIYSGEAALGFKGAAQVWDTENGKLLGSLKNENHGIEDLVVSPDGLILATASRDKTIRLWDLSTYTEKNIFDAKESFPNSIVFMPDGHSLAAVFFNDMSIRLFDTNTMRQRYRVETKAKSFLNMAVSPDGSTLATVDANRLQLWRSSDGSPLASIQDTGAIINAIRFSPDGRSVVVGGLSGTVRVYRIDRNNK